MLTLDIQGAELLALKGADKILDHLSYIYCEINTAELYKGNPLVEEIDNYLKLFKFERVETIMTNHKWGDAFYTKQI
jgi:hypothetical protein